MAFGNDHKMRGLALVAILVEKLNCSPGDIQIVRGQTSRHKTVWMEGKTVEEILKSLPPTDK